MTRLERIEAEIEAHRRSACQACAASVTAFTPCCPVLQDLYRQGREASKKSARKG